MEVAEGVDEAGVEEVREAVAFEVCEAGVFAVLVGICEVNFVMGDVKIAAGDDWALEGLEVGAEVCIEILDAVVDAFEGILGVRDVGIDEGKLIEKSCEDAAFLGMS